MSLGSAFPKIVSLYSNATGSYLWVLGNLIACLVEYDTSKDTLKLYMPRSGPQSATKIAIE